MPSDQSRSINPLRLAKAREQVAGEIKLNSLARLEGLLLDNSGILKYRLSFDFDEAGICIVESGIETELILECQRCFKPVTVGIHKKSLLGMIDGKTDFDALADEYEPLQLDDGELTVEKLVEDELLLAIPLSALHPIEECSGTDEVERINAEAKVQPFAGLAELLKHKD